MGAANCKASAQKDVSSSNTVVKNNKINNVIEPSTSNAMNSPFSSPTVEVTDKQAVVPSTEVQAPAVVVAASPPSPVRRITKKIPSVVQEVINNTILVFQISSAQTDEVYNLFVDSFESVEVDASHVIAYKGRPLDRLFVLESGAVEFVVHPEVIYSVSAGCTLGNWIEYPQVATVRTTLRSVVWSMSLDKFVRILLQFATSTSIMRLRWLSNCPELAALSVFDLVRLMKVGKVVTRDAGDFLYKEGEAATECFLIESGRSSLYSTVKSGAAIDTADSPPIAVNDEIDRDFLIVRAKVEQNVSHTVTPASSSKRGSGTNASSAGTPGGSVGNPSSRKRGSGVGGTSGLNSAVAVLKNLRATPKRVSDFMRGSRERVVRPNDDPTFMGGQQPLCDLREGVFVGQGLIRISDTASRWRSAGSADCMSPLSLVVVEKCEVFSFTLRDFEELFGMLRDVNYEPPSAPVLALHYRLHYPACVAIRSHVPMKFSEDNFQLRSVSGHGTFGVVVTASFTASEALTAVTGSENRHFALKIMSKADVCELERVKHIMDEGAIVSTLRGPFINPVFGTYQTPTELVLVSDIVSGGDLWSVIYEYGSHGASTDMTGDDLDTSTTRAISSGLPIPLIRFYAASLASALAHIHDRNIVYRDLKPENIMLTERGDVRLIDFGFAKRVPYLNKDPRGVLKVYTRTFTVCGTPEYMSPEMLFNLGHNQAADVWSLGVLLYEMLIRKTPFAPKKPDDQVEILTNIALAKVCSFYSF